ncbi:MAG: methionyl-tRNA formyltransferase, partial [Actinomycetota bacterium]|nr:methionyl-tRNA formyltransferase [Actinomycetota bacterium]
GETGPGRPGELHGSAVTTGSGLLGLLDVQPEGKGVMPFRAWANGARPQPGEALGESPAPASHAR